MVQDVDNITPFNGCSIKIIGICVLNINPQDAEYKATLGIPIVDNHTASISIAQYNLKGKEQQSPPPIDLAELAVIEETINNQASSNLVQEDLNPPSNNDSASSRLISFSYLPNLSTLYQSETIKIDWSKMTYQISFKTVDGIFSSYQLETTDGTTLAEVVFEQNGNQIPFGKVAESIGFQLAFQPNQALSFKKQDGSSLLSLNQTDNLYTVIKISNIPTGKLPSGYGHFPLYYDENIITDDKGNSIPDNNRILPSLTNGKTSPLTAPVYCSPLVTSTNGS